MQEEYFDVVDEYGVPTGETVSRSDAHANGIWHRTSHVWILRDHDGKIQVLLQKRCEDKDSFPGCYDISSAGHIPAGCGHEESAIRELKEELGVKAEEPDLICCGSRSIVWDDEFHGKAYHDRQFTKVFILWLDQEEDSFMLQPEEVESVMWIDLDECIDRVIHNTFKHCLELEELYIVREKGLKQEQS